MRKEDKSTIIEQIAATVKEYGHFYFGGYHCHECCYNQHVEKRMFQG